MSVDETGQEPEAAARRRYRVTGTQEVFGVKPGSTFTAALDPEHESHLVEAGHIAPLKKPTTPKKRPKAARAKE